MAGRFLVAFVFVCSLVNLAKPSPFIGLWDFCSLFIGCPDGQHCCGSSASDSVCCPDRAVCCEHEENWYCCPPDELMFKGLPPQHFRSRMFNSSIDLRSYHTNQQKVN